LFAADGSPRPHYAETLSPRLSQNWGELRALLDGPYKYVHGPRPELFDLVEDPRELHDLVNERPQLAATLRDKLSGFLIANRPTKPGRTSAVDEETKQRLLALGYLSGGAGGETEIHEELRSDGLAPQDRAGDLSVVSEARQLLNAGNALAARELARLLVANAPEDPFYNEILASAEAQLGNFEEATAAVDSIGAGGQRASGAKLLLHIAAAQLAKGDAAAARRNLERSLAIHSGAEAHYLLAILLARGGDAAGESREFDAALAVDAKFAPARVDRAVRRAERGDTAGAEEDLLRALADAPYYPVAAYNYGTFLLRRGDRSAALARFRRAVILEPSYLRAHLAVVALLVDGGDRNAAEAAIAALERVAPNSPESEQARRFLETMK
jgi:tetratricopeptide (TPR) repeat protein